VPADPARTTAPPTEALVVHVFVAADGTDQAADLAHVEKIWQACGESLGMTGAVPGAGVEWDGTLAARTRPGSGVYQAVLRREHDVFCLSAVLEPARDSGIGWADLDRQWSAVIGPPSPGTLGVVRVLIGPETPDSPALGGPQPLCRRDSWPGKCPIRTIRESSGDSSSSVRGTPD
jgi:CASPASE and TPR Repeat-Associated N-terminal domain